MTPQAVAISAARRRRGRRTTGFSLLEVLFAILVLGIGFIMAAAVFPVAVRQTQTNQEQSVAATVGRSGLSIVDRSHYFAASGQSSELLIATDYATPGPTAYVLPFQPMDASTTPSLTAPPPDARLWPAIMGNVVLPEDPHTAWLPLYSRRAADNFAQVYIFVLQSRIQPNYNPVTDIVRQQTGTPATLEVRALNGVVITPRASSVLPDMIQFNTASPVPNTSADNREAIGPGAYLVIGDDQTTKHPGYCNGWILRVGNAASDSTGPVPDGNGYPTRWELMPGGDLSANDPGPDGIAGTADDISTTGITGKVYVVGRTLNQTSGVYDGPVQDTGVFTGSVLLR